MHKKRSKLRLFFGVIYYTLKKHFYWYWSKTNFAKNYTDFLPIEIFKHQTILQRKLKDTEIWMQQNKIINLKIATKKLNKIIIKPGQIMSYWRQIGKPTKLKGYQEGMVLCDGKVISGIGGGLCQLSNLIYWMTLHTPLTIVERWRHGYDVFPDVKRDQPFGSGATCAYPNIDLQIKNNTKQNFQLRLELTDKYLVGKWLSDQPIKFKYQIIEKDHNIKHEWWGKYTRHNKIFRKIINKNTNKEIGEEFVTKNQAIMMYSPLLDNNDSK